MIKTKLRSTALYGLLIAVMAGGLTAPARAEYPDRPVHVIVPVAAGGGVDVMARLLAQRLGERLHQSFVVENKPGAAGVIGSKYVIAAPADGYTLLYTPSSLSLAVVVHQTPPYDVSKDFTPIINVAISPYVLGVNQFLGSLGLADQVGRGPGEPAVDYLLCQAVRGAEVSVRDQSYVGRILVPR
jgi:tripartite-type tricarboxylate transporter receptor subunit TctC